jgi:hypothetical protein
MVLAVVSGEEDVVPGPKDRKLRIPAVGVLPPFRQAVENGVRREVPPVEGSVPPRNVKLIWSKEEDRRELGQA